MASPDMHYPSGRSDRPSISHSEKHSALDIQTDTRPISGQCRRFKARTLSAPRLARMQSPLQPTDLEAERVGSSLLALPRLQKLIAIVGGQKPGKGAQQILACLQLGLGLREDPAIGRAVHQKRCKPHLPACHPLGPQAPGTRGRPPSTLPVRARTPLSAARCPGAALHTMRMV